MFPKEDPEKPKPSAREIVVDFLAPPSLRAKADSWRKLGLFALLALSCGSCHALSPNHTASPTMALIRSRGYLICGVEGTMPGLSWLAPDNREKGLDADICRAVAASLLGDGEKVEFHHLSAAERFTALASGEVDLLARNTTVTLGRDAAGGNAVSFAPIVFYDNQGLLVRRDSGIRSPSYLHGQTICVVTGTTIEQNLADWMRRWNLAYTPLKFQTHDQTYAAYLQGRCKAVTSGQVLLTARRSTFSDPEEHILLKEELSKEPFAPATRQGDPVWADAVRWTVYALFKAEELGITQANVKERLASVRKGPSRGELSNFLGIDGNLGRQLGLMPNFGVQIVAAVGNYGELFERHLGPSSPLGLERGRQRLARDGGLITAPPFR
jgi:general L-amino acid transport system substrate-binding protein